jgi:hypothetical protein
LRCDAGARIALFLGAARYAITDFDFFSSVPTRTNRKQAISFQAV